MKITEEKLKNDLVEMYTYYFKRSVEESEGRDLLSEVQSKRFHPYSPKSSDAEIANTTITQTAVFHRSRCVHVI